MPLICKDLFSFHPMQDEVCDKSWQVRYITEDLSIYQQASGFVMKDDGLGIQLKCIALIQCLSNLVWQIYIKIRFRLIIICKKSVAIWSYRFKIHKRDV